MSKAKSKTERAADLIGVKTGLATTLIIAINECLSKGQYLPAGICAICLGFDLLAIYFQLTG